MSLFRWIATKVASVCWNHDWDVLDPDPGGCVVQCSKCKKIELWR